MMRLAAAEGRLKMLAIFLVILMVILSIAKDDIHLPKLLRLGGKECKEDQENSLLRGHAPAEEQNTEYPPEIPAAQENQSETPEELGETQEEEKNGETQNSLNPPASPPAEVEVFPPPAEENKEDETPEEMEESLEEEDGETCTKLPAPADGTCAAANPSTLDNGVHGGKDAYAGWYSLNNDGCCQDFCRWVGGSGSGGDPGLQIKHRDSYWSCRPAGYAACTYFEGFGETFNFAKCDGQGLPAVSNPVIEAETAPPPPAEEINEETPEELEESLEEEDGETCTQLPAPADGSCAAANPSTLDNGVHGGNDAYAGWYSLNNDGCCQDFCRWVGSSGSGGDPSLAIKHRDSYWSCRPAGYAACTYFEGFGDTFNFAKCESQGVPATPEPEEEETPEELEESLEEEDGETCTQLPAPADGVCAAANPSMIDNGVHGGKDPYAGWFSLNNDGCCQDFCRWVGSSGSGGHPSAGIKHRDSYWSCRPAGYTACTYFEGFGETFNYAKCDGQGLPAAPQPVVEAETAPPPPVKEETPEELEESLEEEDGETCTQLPAPADGVCAAANPSTLDNGVHSGQDPYTGWYSLNNDGCCQDFCRWVGSSGSGGDPSMAIKHHNSYWSCRPAGYAACTYFEGFGDTFNFAKCDGQGVPASPKPNGGAKAVAPSPEAPPASKPEDFVTMINQHHQRIVLLSGSGVTSQLMNMMAQKIYFADGKHDGFMVVDSEYGYRWDANTGLLKGFFSPTSLSVLPWDEVMPSNFGAPTAGDIIGRMGGKYTDPAGHFDAVIAIDRSYRKRFKNAYSNKKHNFGDLYDRMVVEGCANLQFNDQARQAFRTLLNQNSIPDFTQVKSVAFHVRRGDKVKLKESRAYTGEEYVTTFVKAAKGGAQSMEACFIATDDYSSIGEITNALVSHGITCQVYTLTSANEQGHAADARTNRDNTLQFLTEFSVLVDATYFVGTFNSNVGGLAAVLRRCHYTDAPHYSHSYGVDSEGWFFDVHV
ncbi:expressed unknown protein [Seminavis robusta]|uniref:Uncharacterized protein n=1 Tax=Seminavis robusta TaxID=568900 RepID=A0A9N8DYU2_9STRA|nr:expressed unknown protein [Seminavis robusta]|eukprot:Sro484_g152270.1 n/a (993) ;mRNA; r:41229-44207